MGTAEKILYKAFELFKRFGVRSVTMDEIAVQCGVSKKTVYQFFEDKDTLVEKIIEEVITRSREFCSNQTVNANDALQELFLSMKMTQQMIEGVNQAVINDLRKYHNSAYIKIEEYKHQFLYSFFKRNIERGIEEGIYRSDMKVDIIASFYLTSVMLAYEQDIFSKSRYTLLDIDYEISTFLMNGLVNEKGLTLLEKYKQQKSVTV